MTRFSSFKNKYTYAETQHEAFALLTDAGRRVPVVFSHVLLTHISNNQNIRKGDTNQTFVIPAPGANVPRRSVATLTKEVPGTILS